MKRIAMGTALFAAALCAQAQTAPVTATGAWARPTVQGQPTSAAYLTLTAREPVSLVGASTPVAGVAEVHEMKMAGNVMQMQAVDAIQLEPGKPVELKPGGYHIMLMQLKTQLKPQASVPLTLTFRNAAGVKSELQVSVPVSATAPAPGMQMPMQHSK
jgi:copper(I)-binding protein